ncbi:MAG: DNA polymerase I [Pseudomonadota bacterium]
MKEATSPDSLFVFDGSSYIYRAFFAIRGLSTSAGIPTNASFGFTNMLYKVLSEKQPGYAAMVFDARGETFRHRSYEFYKANRPPMPEDLRPQIGYIKQIVAAFNLSAFELEGFEADDIIATIARRAEAQGWAVVVVSGDKDLLQLVSPRITVWDPMKDVVLGLPEVRGRYGLEPRQVADVMALVGDAIDNVPGVPGIGEKTAVKLIQRFGSVEELLASLDQIDKPRLRQSLAANMEQARLSKELVLLDDAVPVEIDLAGLRRRPLDIVRLRQLFRELEFTRLLEEITPTAGLDAGPQACLTAPQDLLALSARLTKTGCFSLEARTRREAAYPSSVFARLQGLAFATPAEAAFVPLEEGASSPLLAAVAPIIENPELKKIVPSLKATLLALAGTGIELRGPVFDLSLASYVINPERHDHGLESIARERLDRRLEPEAGNRTRNAAPPSLEQEATRACTRAQAARQCARPLAEELAGEGLEGLLEELELPLARVLADMELAGVKIDHGAMALIARDFDSELHQRQAAIFALAGEEFNINSPRQLAAILFEKLRLPLGKRTVKRTAWSTDFEVLGQLAQIHPLPKEVIEFRLLSKLKGTYVDALPKLINPATGRIHTSFNQTVTATGRLSSSNPNLQNIPVRGEHGKRIRATFVAEQGCRLLSADYSQIELRLLAHLSNDRALIEAFRNGTDIHARTAARIFGIHPEMVTEEMRRQAKVINFGIIYGMSAFGLAKELGIGRRQAQKYIDRYFASHPGVSEYWQDTLAQARARGYVETILGRRRYVPALASRTPHIRALAERTAVNAPLQGSAADVIKRAMLDLHAALRRQGLQTRIILQVHDELVLEVPEAELLVIEGLVREKMTRAVELRVPLEVKAAAGRSWAEAH